MTLTTDSQGNANYVWHRHTVPAAWPRHDLTTASPDTRLSIVVDEYLPAEQRKSGPVLLLTHGTSFSKDFWRPIIDLWLRPQCCVPISRVLALDAVNHGDSAVANSQRLGQEGP